MVEVLPHLHLADLAPFHPAYGVHLFEQGCGFFSGFHACLQGVEDPSVERTQDHQFIDILIIGVYGEPATRAVAVPTW